MEVLILIGVLEHLRDLRPALRNVCQKLSSHGLVYVELPDVTGFARFLDAPYRQFSTEHVIFFSPASLSAALAAEGFRPLLVKQDSRPHSGLSVMPVLWGIFEKAEPLTAGPAFDPETRPALESYIHASARVERDLVSGFLNTLVETQQPIFVWGVGTLTRRLLSTTRLGEANIVAFIDSNPNIQGQSFDGIPCALPGWNQATGTRPF